MWLGEIPGSVADRAAELLLCCWSWQQTPVGKGLVLCCLCGKTSLKSGRDRLCPLKCPLVLGIPGKSASPCLSGDLGLSEERQPGTRHTLQTKSPSQQKSKVLLSDSNLMVLLQTKPNTFLGPLCQQVHDLLGWITILYSK